MNNRKVVHINTADNQGGAARAAFRIHAGLQRLGWDSHMLVGIKSETDHEEIDLIPRQDKNWKRWWIRLVKLAEQKSGLEYLLLPWKRQLLKHPFLSDNGVLHLHNLHGGYFSLQVLPLLSQGRSVVWTIHDLWALTGHCYFPDLSACDRWKTGCGHCPGLRQESYYPLSIDTTHRLWKRKSKLYAKSKILYVGQSRWTVDRILSSPLANKSEVHFIPYGLDVDVFRPLDKDNARQVLGIPKDVKVLYFSAVSLSSERKGWAYLKKALETCLGNLKVVVLLAGEQPPSGMDLPNIQIIRLGNLTNDHLNVLAYNAADLFVGASLYETFGQVFSEAMACGTPSVGFDTSGVRDVIRHEKTGYLAKFKDADDLGKGIDLLLSNDGLRRQMGIDSRKVAVAEYSSQLQAQRYADLYQSLTERKSPSIRLDSYVGHSK